MIRVLVVDDHPAVRTGLVAMLRAEPDSVPVASAADTEAAIAAARPGVAVVDYHLKRGDGLLACRELKSLPAPPRILIYSAFAEHALGLPAAVAGAHGVVDKGVPPDELFERVRTVARGETVLAITPEAITAGAARLGTEDLPILGLSIGRTPRAEIAEVLGLDERELDRRVEAMLSRLKVSTGSISSRPEGRYRPSYPTRRQRAADRAARAKRGGRHLRSWRVPRPPAYR